MARVRTDPLLTVKSHLKRQGLRLGATFAMAVALPAGAEQTLDKPRKSASTPAHRIAQIFKEKPATQRLIAALRKGGYVLYMRHVTTDGAHPDHTPIDLNNCSTQRPLSAEGRAEAKNIGKAMRDARIPLAEIYASPLCRTRETALLGFGANFTIDNNLSYTAMMTTAEKKPVLEAIRGRLAEPVPAGGSRLLVSHAHNLADLIGYFIEDEGTIAVFKPMGSKGFEYQASIRPSQWPRLVR